MRSGTRRVPDLVPTARGARSATSPLRLPSDKWVDFGNLDIRRYDGLPGENLGVPPDIRVAQPLKDRRACHDRQLEYALTLLR